MDNGQPDRKGELQKINANEMCQMLTHAAPETGTLGLGKKRRGEVLQGCPRKGNPA